MDARLKCPFNMQVSGPSQSGKSVWVARLIAHANLLLEDPPEKIYWYTPHGHLPKGLPAHVESRLGLPWDRQDDDEEDEDDEEGCPCHKLIVIDDFADVTKNSHELTAMFTKHSHHNNSSIIQMTQNMFWPGSDSRTRSLNIHYFVLMRQMRDQKQIRLLADQIGQNNTEKRGILQAYNSATGQRPYSYLLVSVHPRDPPELLLRADLFPDEASSPAVFLLLTKTSRKRV